MRNIGGDGTARNQRLRVTRFENQNREPLTKRIGLNPDGTIAKGTDANMNAGGFVTLEFADVFELADYILANHGRSDWALAYGIAKQERGEVAAKWQFETGRAPAGSLPRSNDTFIYPQGVPGVHFQDLDGIQGVPYPTPQQYDEILTRVLPWLGQIKRVYLPSSSSHLHKDGRWHSPKFGYHLLYAISDASAAVALGRRMFITLFDAGYGYQLIMKDGDRDPRTLIDRMVWQGSRLDFAFGAVLEDGLRQDMAGGTVRFDGAPFVNVDGVKAPDMEVWKAASKEYARTMRETDGAAAAVKAQTKRVEIDRLIAGGVEQARAEMIIARAYDGGVRELHGEFILYTNDWKPFTVDDTFRNPEYFDRMSLRPPLDPHYGPSKAKLFLSNQRSFPVCRSYLHGEKVYQLLPSAAWVFRNHDAPKAQGL